MESVTNEELVVKAKQHSRIGAVILAAGTSQRMGEPKQLLLLDGKPILERTLDTVRGTNIADIVLVLGFEAEAIRQRVKVNGVKIAVNATYQKGLGSSLRTGLSALDAMTEAALIVLADQPFVLSRTLNKIVERYRQSSAQIVIPMYRGFRGNPVLLDRSVFPEVMAIPGDIGCRAIFGDHTDGIIKVPVDDIGVLLDIDNKDDYARSQSFLNDAESRAGLINTADLCGRQIQNATNQPGDRDELIIVGTEPIALALAKLGKLLKFRVTVVDPLVRVSDLPHADEVLNTLDLSQLQAASGRYVVISSHGKFDEEAVPQALAANADYVALVANRRRAQEVRRTLETKGQTADTLARLHAPAGLEISARTPEEIALSIMAEIVSVRRQSES